MRLPIGRLLKRLGKWLLKEGLEEVAERAEKKKKPPKADPSAEDRRDA